MRWVRRLGYGLGVVVLLAIGPQACGRATASCSGYDDLLIEAVERCPRARELLGDDIGPAVVGCGCGKTETSSGAGTASWLMSVAGSRDRGLLDFDAEKHGGRWSLTRAVLDVNGEGIDLLACGASAPRSAHAAQQRAPGAAPGRKIRGSFNGRVLRSTHPGVAAGRCEGTLAGGHGILTRVTVRCGGAAIYEGHGELALDGGRWTYDDPRTFEQDETPACRLVGTPGQPDGAGGTLVLWDIARGETPAYEIAIAL